MWPLGLSIFKFLQPKNGTTSMQRVGDIEVNEMCEAALEYQIRELSFWTCVNLVASAVGRCEVRTYVQGEEVKDREYYLWNIEPNTNQNSTAFWHKAIARLYETNELLIISTRKRDGYDAVAVADDWEEPEDWPSKQHEYKGVKVGDLTYDKTFRENEVLHLRLHQKDMTLVTRKIYESYYRLVKAAMNAYQWDNGQHWKVHVNQMAGGKDGWADTFQQMLEAQIRPFLNSNGAILPEFDGYEYSDIGGKAGKTVKSDTRDVRAMIDDIFTFTARGFGIPDVLIQGNVEAVGHAQERFLSGPVDTFCDQFSEEATRKRYGFDAWKAGSYLRMDSSAIGHFDLFGQAANIEKLVGSGWSVNDIRRAAGEAPINEPWADQHFMTRNIGTIGELIAPQA